jgi:hypothetical protein
MITQSIKPIRTTTSAASNTKTMYSKPFTQTKDVQNPTAQPTATNTR